VRRKKSSSSLFETHPAMIEYVIVLTLLSLLIATDPAPGEPTSLR
jgi:hypothetical protein